MKIVSAISEVVRFTKEAKNLGKTIGLVPTMGFFTRGTQKSYR